MGGLTGNESNSHQKRYFEIGRELYILFVETYFVHILYLFSLLNSFCILPFYVAYRHLTYMIGAAQAE